MNFRFSNRRAIPLWIAISSAIISIGTAIAVVKAPSSEEIEAAKSSQRLDITTRTPERAAEDFYEALVRCDLDWAFRLACGQEGQRLRKILNSSGSNRKPCLSLEKEYQWGVSAHPYPVFHDSIDFGEGAFGLVGVATDDPKDNTRGITLRFTLKKRDRGWCVEQLSLDRYKR